MERQVFSTEALGAATTSSTSWQHAVSLAFTPDAERTYLILATAQTSNQNTPGTGPICRLMQGASRRSADLFAMDGHPDGWWPIAQADIFQSGASPSEQTWAQEYTRHGTFATVAIREACLYALRLEAGDLWARSDAELSHATSTYQDIVQITIPEAGEYLLLAIGSYNVDIDGAEADHIIDVAGETLCRLHGRPGVSNTGDGLQGTANGYTGLVRRTLAADDVVKVRFRNTGGEGKTRNRYTTLVALKTSNFAAHGYAEDQGETSTSGSATKLTLGHEAPADIPHLVLAHIHLNTDGTRGEDTSQGITRTRRNAALHWPEAAAVARKTGRDISNGGLQMSLGVLSDDAWQIELEAENAAKPVRAKNATLAILQLEPGEPPPPPPPGIRYRAAAGLARTTIG
jgi:hypothetical protein